MGMLVSVLPLLFNPAVAVTVTGVSAAAIVCPTLGTADGVDTNGATVTVAVASSLSGVEAAAAAAARD